MNRSFSWALLIACGLAEPQNTLAQGYGHVSGQFVLQGAMPKIAAVKIMGKDIEVCAAKPLPEETLIVDDKTKGIANIVVYLKKKPEGGIHPDLKVSKEKQVVFDQKDCRFTPHFVLVRTDQEILVKSNDPVAHSTKITPFRNPAANITIRPNDRVGTAMKCINPESIPTTVTCAFHPHMVAYWMILDHPYMAISDKEGKFKIENLPEGDYEFTVWHERVGYIDRALAVVIDQDATDELGEIAVPAAKIKVD